MRAREHSNKIVLLMAIVMLYLVFGATVLVLVSTGIIKRTPFVPILADNSTDTDPVIVHESTGDSLAAALAYMHQHLEKGGHIDLYEPLYSYQNISEYNYTNSEAISYHLQVLAQQGNKQEFDAEIAFVEKHMMHPEGSYLMWRLNDQDVAEGEGQNIAPDADLRALHALYTAKDKWGDPHYDTMIDRLATGLERVALNNASVLVAYGGMSGDKPWRADVSYLAYSDFQVYDRLANTRGGPWPAVYSEMRDITLKAQIWNGLYNSEYYSNGNYGNGIDGNKYSINSLWIMVRFAESDDPALMASARKSLAFYQEQYAKDERVYSAYTSSGEPATKDETPWNYALIARAASALGEKPFAQLMESRMLAYQDHNQTSPQYGAILEGARGDERVGQFTTHECILTMQQINGIAQKFK